MNIPITPGCVAVIIMGTHGDGQTNMACTCLHGRIVRVRQFRGGQHQIWDLEPVPCRKQAGLMVPGAGEKTLRALPPDQDVEKFDEVEFKEGMRSIFKELVDVTEKRFKHWNKERA